MRNMTCISAPNVPPIISIKNQQVVEQVVEVDTHCCSNITLASLVSTHCRSHCAQRKCHLDRYLLYIIHCLYTYPILHGSDRSMQKRLFINPHAMPASCQNSRQFAPLSTAFAIMNIRHYHSPSLQGSCSEIHVAWMETDIQYRLGFGGASC